MTTMAASSRRPEWLHVLSGGFVLGALDLVFACGFWAVARDVPPVRILQSIAAGVQGEAAFAGGAASAWIGVACHFFIATTMVLAYRLAGSQWPALLRYPVRNGLPYGLLLYAVMNWIVVPLSNAPPPRAVHVPWIVSSIAMHMVFGVICAWFARRACVAGPVTGELAELAPSNRTQLELPSNHSGD